MREVDLNSDLGESFGSYEIGGDGAMLAIVTSVNVACGFHGSDAVVMHQTAAQALSRGVDVGAHPGFNDLNGFGRRKIIGDSPADIEKMLIYQIAARALQTVREQAIHTVGGRKADLRVHTISVHGDNPQGVAIARAVRVALEGDGVRIRPLSQLDF
ncbi:LamB/YcsF family protein [Cupriavidus basilensis OR16]|uniref:LamB/YcsF family protein n=1 Tax=Cupriavidus basilensis OR16 TaxID=1127483 RepID=H1S159_9BURK|nr:LamB/YcsF family protein [Cupriavidus basilensis]EHP43672.1 LamB/YcsF family protein [Cupriavidus basilensis OR16]